MKKKMILLTLAVVMAASVFGGCANSSKGNDKSTSTQSADTKKTYKVGIIQYVDDASLNQIESSIQKELDAKGKELNVTFDYKDYTFNGQADQSTLNQIASELVSDKVDILVPIATPTAMVMQNATEDNQIPIVFSAVTDPVSAKLVESMDQPGGNITGTSDALDTKAVMNLMFSANKNIKSVGLLYDKSQDSSTKAIEEAKAYLKEKNVSVVEKTGTTTDELINAADALVAAKVDAVFTPTDNTVMTAELSIYEKFMDAKIPHYAGADSFALNGAFCGYGVDYKELGTTTADMVVDILVNHKKPADTAVKTLNNGVATINTDVASALGIDYSMFKGMCESVVETKTAKEFK